MKRLLLSVALICFAATLWAQEDKPLPAFGTHVNLADSARLYKTLLQNTPIEPEFTYAPHFAIVGYQGKFYFSTGVRMRFTTSLDWGNPIENPQGMSIADLKPAADGYRSLLQMAAGTSKLYFNIIGFPHSEHQVGLFVSLGLDADGNNTYRVSTSQAYMRYRNLQCGYFSSLYDDPGADPYTIDAEGPCASGAHKNVGINYQKALTSKISTGMGLEMPKVKYTQCVPSSFTLEQVEALVKNDFQYVPDVPAYIHFATGKNSHLRLSGVLRHINYYNLEQSANRRTFGWGLKLTGTCDIGHLTLCCMAQGGQAIAHYFAGFNGDNLDLVPDGNALNGDLVATKTAGFIASAQYNYTPHFFSTLIYSNMSNITPAYSCEATEAHSNQIRMGQYASGNLIWRISDLFSAGVEYALIASTTEGGTTLYNNRIYGMFMMTF